MDAERLIEKEFGRRMPFKVPDGYFDRFARDFMDGLPAEGKVARRVPSGWRRAMAWAACAMVAVVIAGIALLGGDGGNGGDGGATARFEPTAVEYDDYIIDQFTEYALLDNEDIYAWVLGE